ncbi:MAG: MG2 domain-containing protein, partial [Bacteroidota bacterium]
ISNANAIAGARVDFYNFQQQMLGSISTSSAGMASITLEEEASFAVITHEDGVAYVRLLDGESLSVSDFDTGGKRNQSQLNAFIYTDRGVYRPGDTVYLFAMIDDSAINLPEDHPVKLIANDARGAISYQSVATTHFDRIYTFKIPTSPSDPTGVWRVELQIGATSFFKNIRVETIKPNRLKIDLATEGNIQLRSKNRNRVSIHSEYLQGATASGLDVTVDGSFKQVSPDFDGYKDFTFVDPAREGPSGEVRLFEGVLSDSGNRTFKLSLDPNQSYPAMLEASLNTPSNKRTSPDGPSRAGSTKVK